MRLAQGRIKPLAVRRRLMALPPLSRRLLLGTIDVLFIPLAIWLSFWLRTGEPLSDWMLRTFWLFPATWAVDVTPFVGPGLMRVGGCGHPATPC